MSSCDSASSVCSEEEEDDALEAIQVWRPPQPAKSKKNSEHAADSGGTDAPLRHRMKALEAKLQAWRDCLDKTILADLRGWLDHCVAADTTINTQKVRSCWIYSPSTNNVDVSCSRPVGSGSESVLQQLARHATSQGISAALLRPSVMNSKHSGSKLAQNIFEQVAPDGDVPIACTLHDVADVCTTRCKRGKRKGHPDLLVLIPDAEKVDVHALQLLVRALSSVQETNPGFVPALALGLATHPTLLHPHLDPRILGRLRPAEYRMPSQRDSLGKCMVQLQTCDSRKVHQALEKLLADSPETHKLLVLEAKEAGIEPKAKGSSRSSSSKCSEVVLTAVMALCQAVLDWQLCLHWVNLAAEATGQADQLDWWRLSTAAASPGFIQNPAASYMAARQRNAPSKARKLAAGTSAGAARAISARDLAGEAFFADTETARQMTSCLSAVSKLSDAQAKELVYQLVEKTDSHTHGRAGQLGEFLSNLEHLVEDAANTEKEKAEQAAARAAACIPEGGSSDEDADIEDFQQRLGNATDNTLETSPMRISGAGCWDMLEQHPESNIEDACLSRHADLQGSCPNIRGALSQRAPVKEPTAKMEATAYDTCCVVTEVSPMRITGSGDEGGWPGCYEEDIAARSDVQPCPSAAIRSRRRARLWAAINTQGSTNPVPVQAANALAGSTHGSATGALPVGGPAAGARSPFQPQSSTLPVPVGAPQCQEGVLEDGGACKPIPQVLQTDRQGIDERRFAARAASSSGQEDCPEKNVQGCVGPAQKSETAGGVSTALLPSLGGVPSSNLSGGSRRSARKSVQNTAAKHVAIVAARTRSAAVCTTSTSDAITASQLGLKPQSTAGGQEVAAAPGNMQRTCSSLDLNENSAAPSNKAAVVAENAGASQPGAPKRRSARLAGEGVVSRLAPVPEDEDMVDVSEQHLPNARNNSAAVGDHCEPVPASVGAKEQSGYGLTTSSTPTKPARTLGHRSDMKTPSQQRASGSKGPRGSASLATPNQDRRSKGSPGSIGRTPTSVRRTPRQSMGQFLAQQARAPNSAGPESENDIPGLCMPGRVAGDSLGSKLSKVLRDAWLYVLQTHPSTLPCAHVLSYDDVTSLKAKLHPSTSADMHAVLSNPAPWMDAIQKGAKASDAPKEKKQARPAKRKRKKLKTVERTCDGAGPSAQVPPEGAEGRCEKLQSAIDVGSAAEDLPWLTAAFCQAVAELEVMGYVQRNKRKGALKLQRNMFPPPAWPSA